MTIRWLVITSVLLLVCAVHAKADDSAGPTAGIAEDSGSLLAAVRLGCESARSRISTRVGAISEHLSFWKEDRKWLETETVYRVVSEGTKVRVTADTTYIRNDWTTTDPGGVPIAPGTVMSKQLAFDGEKVVEYWPAENRAAIAGPESAIGSELRSITRTIEEISPGAPDLAKEMPAPRYTTCGPAVVGREVVDGEECVVVELVHVRVNSDGQEISWYHRYWIAPDMGFTALKTEDGYRGGRYGDGVVSVEIEAEARQYASGLWGVSRMWARQYRLDQLDTRELKIETVVTVADDYQLNAPVTEEMLRVQLPSGTKVSNELIDAHYTVP